MAEAKTISVCTKREPAWKVAVRAAITWGYLIGSEAISHLWFGGSWVIDLLIIIAGIALLVGKISKVTGFSVEMTTAEVRLWVAGGMPRDIKEWQEQRKIREVS